MNKIFAKLNIDPINPEIFNILPFLQRFSLHNFQTFSLFSDYSNLLNILERGLNPCGSGANSMVTLKGNNGWN